jgi:hypothetical protein
VRIADATAPPMLTKRSAQPAIVCQGMFAAKSGGSELERWDE